MAHSPHCSLRTQPFKRENKRTRARDSATAAAAAAPASPTVDAPAGLPAAEAGSADGGGARGGGGVGAPPEPGAVVEFPLSRVVRESLQDGRTHGLALLVGRNIDRGDAGAIPHTLPRRGGGGHCHSHRHCCHRCEHHHTWIAACVRGACGLKAFAATH